MFPNCCGHTCDTEIHLIAVFCVMEFSWWVFCLGQRVCVCVCVRIPMHIDRPNLLARHRRDLKARGLGCV